jgi:N-acyl-phosphatidylethanolamine-hydrolysing phospholipase D
VAASRAASATVTLTPAPHGSGRGLLGRNRTLRGGVHVRAADCTVSFAGDRGYGAHVHDSRGRLGPADLALLPIRTYAPRGYAAPQHMDPDEAVRGFDEPRRELEAARRRHRLAEQDFTVLEPGETRRFTFAQLEHATELRNVAA